MNIVDIIRSALGQLPQTNNSLEAYQQMLDNPNVPQPLRMAGKVAYNAPGVGLGAIQQNLTNPPSPQDIALTYGGIAPKLGPESIDAITQLANQTIRKGNTPNPEDYQILLQTASEQLSKPLKKLSKSKIYDVASQLLSHMQSNLDIPRFRPR